MTDKTNEFHPNRQGKLWLKTEEKQLLEEIQRKIPIDMIAELHERTPRGITSRLREIAANYYFNNNLQISEIQKFTGLSASEISDTISKRETQQKSKNEKEMKKKSKLNKSPETTDSKEIISLLKDIKSLLEIFLSKHS
jgi:hypothetical protein